MANQRGQRLDDVLGRKIWSAQELQDMPRETPSPEMYLAILFFLSRHAANTRVFFVMSGEPDDGGSRGERGCG